MPLRRERDDKVHDSIIEERIQRERPCRTLFIRNIKASLFMKLSLRAFRCSGLLVLSFSREYSRADQRHDLFYSMKRTVKMFVVYLRNTAKSRHFLILLRTGAWFLSLTWVLPRFKKHVNDWFNICYNISTICELQNEQENDYKGLRSAGDLWD